MERNFEIATGTLCLRVSSKGCMGTLRGSPLEKTFANCTHAIVSLLKAWNMTVVWIVCDDTFLTPLQEGTHHKLLLAQGKTKFCQQDGKLYYSRYSEVYSLTFYYHWQLLASHFY